MSFKTSVNIKFDIGKDEFIKRYLPTPSHAEAFKNILQGFDEEGNRSHIIIGPYGTGKTLLATIIGSIVSKMINNEEIKNLAKKFDQVDDTLAEKVVGIGNLKTKYIPILLSGNEGRFRQSILSVIISKLKEAGIDVVLPGLAEKVVESINVWKESFPKTYDEFCITLENDGKSLSGWLEKIKGKNEKELKYFSEIYPSLTSGALFDVDYDHSFMSQMEYINDLLIDNGLGLFIVYDEFGRFLQGLSTSQLSETMQDIQDIAELINRSNTMQLLFITHKSIRQYFGGFDEEIVREFQRIEKRFKQYFIQSDQATFLRIAESIVIENIKDKPIIPPEKLDETLGILRKYALFPSLNQTEREKIVIKEMYPLHPVALYMLPYLTRVFGQNERTLFTFLESNESSGFLSFVIKNPGYYLAHQLYDYFFPVYYESDFDEDVSRHFLLYRKAMARIPDDLKQNEIMTNIVKFISLWSICGLQSEQKLTTEFIQFALDSNEETANLLDLLSDNKIIRYNRINEYWELFAGSAVNIDDILETEYNNFELTDQHIHDTLYSNLNKKYFYPEEHNDRIGMTRFATINLLLDSDVYEDNYSVQPNTDITIFYVLLKNVSIKNKNKIEKKLIEISNSDNVIVVLHPYSIESIKDDIVKYNILKSLRNDKNVISEDMGVREELEILLGETSYRISEYLSMLEIFNEELWWYYGKQKSRVLNIMDLSSLLSDVCDRLYELTPVILNESFNKYNITGPQRNGAIKLIDGVIEDYELDQFGLKGNGPEYSIFASIFKNNGRFDENINNLDFDNLEGTEFGFLRTALINYLDENTSGNFKELIDIFRNPPYGIRTPVIPVLFVALLRDRWNEFSLYSNDMFVPGLNGEKLFDIIVYSGAENYEYTYEHNSEEYISFYNQIEIIFKEYIDSRLDGKPRMIIACGTLMKWLRFLPRMTQLSEDVQSEFKWLRECILKTEINPQLYIDLIFERYKNDYSSLIKVKEYAESYTAQIKKDLVNVVLEALGMGSIEEIIEWSIKVKDDLIENKLIDSLQQLGKSSESNHDWISEFIRAYIGLEIEDWSDATFSVFINQLMYDYEVYLHVMNEQEVQISSNDLITVKLNNSKRVISRVDLSVKSETILDNLERLLSSAGRNVPKQELDFVVFKLFEKHLLRRESL